MKNRLGVMVGALILGLCAMTMAQDQLRISLRRSSLTSRPAWDASV